MRHDVSQYGLKVLYLDKKTNYKKTNTKHPCIFFSPSFGKKVVFFSVLAQTIPAASLTDVLISLFVHTSVNVDVRVSVF